MKKITVGLLAMVGMLGMIVPNAFAEITTGMPADGLLGQTTDGEADFTASAIHNGQAGPNASGLRQPWGTVLDTENKRLFVADSANNRVLMFNLDSENVPLDFEADAVLGQSNFTLSASATTQDRFNRPMGIDYDSSRDLLYVADGNNNRVMIFDVAQITDGENAIHVIGQSDFTTNSVGVPQASRTNYPHDIAIDESRQLLYVAEFSGSRLSVFDVDTITDGEDAVNVLGQDDLVSQVSQTDANSTTTATAVDIDEINQRAFVTINDQHRVLVFDVDTITDGEDATYVIGQPDFVSSDSATTASSLAGPYGVVYDPADNVLFVSDLYNNRVTVYDLDELENGMDATYVVGQPDFTTNSNGTTDSKMYWPISIGHDPASGTLFVGEYSNNRVLYFNGITSPTDPEIASPATTTAPPVVPENDDSDDDGISDELESSAPNSGDGNGDGVADSEQDNVTSLDSSITNDYVTFVSSGDGECTNAAVDIAEASSDGDFIYPHGLVGF